MTRHVDDDSHPTHRRDNEAAKDELAAQMEYGMNASQRMEARAALEERQRAAAAPSHSPDDMCDEIQREIDDRWRFLAEMQAAGRAEQYKAQVKSEIAARVQQLKRLDALITERDAHLLGGGEVGDTRRGAPVAVGGMMQNARQRMVSGKI